MHVKKLPSILIVSDEYDAHIPPVVAHLPEGSVVIIGPQPIGRGTELSYRLTATGKIDISYNGLPLTQVKSVWYRKPTLPLKEFLPVPEAYAEYSVDALKSHFTMLYAFFENATWVSNYFSLLRAGNKMLQLKLARKLGFRVPDTLLTSSGAVASQFIQRHPSIIIKPQSRYGFPIIRDGIERHTGFFSTKKRRGEPIDLANLELAPSFFQQAVEDIEADIRATVIGTKVFAAAITNPGFDESTGTRDWRVGHFTDTIHIEACALPKDIARLCVAHVRELGLTFGTLDLILDKKGRYWFIENNPNGQWYFVEDVTGQPMAREMAHFLRYGRNT